VIASSPEFHLNMMLKSLMDALNETTHTISWKCKTGMQPETTAAFYSLCAAIKRLDQVTANYLEQYTEEKT